MIKTDMKKTDMKKTVIKKIVIKKTYFNIIRIAVFALLAVSLFIASSCSSRKVETDLAPDQSVQTVGEQQKENTTGNYVGDALEKKQNQEMQNQETQNQETQSQDGSANNKNTNDVDKSGNSKEAQTTNKEEGQAKDENESQAIDKVDNPTTGEVNGDSKSDDIINDSGSEETDKKDTVSMMILGPEDIGVILSPTDAKIEEDDTVIDVLISVTKDKKISLEYKGSNAFTYIEGIDNIYEFDYGNKSGWIFRVNGTVPSKSAGTYVVKAGDEIEFIYSLDMGKGL